MSHWIFCVTAHKDKGISDPSEIIEQRFQDQFWGLGEKTPNRRALKAGDRVIFYLGIPHCAFAASATLASDSFEVSPSEQEQLSHGMGFYRAQHGVRLIETKRWERPCRVQDILSVLSFIENKENWVVYFQGGVRYLPEADFEAITQRVVPVVSSTSPRDADEFFASRAEFALEAHLEEFMEELESRRFRR